MRILFVTNPFKSHLLVQAPLAWALRTAGHEVCVAAPPNQADEITRAGLTGVLVGPDQTLVEKVEVQGPLKPSGVCDPYGKRTGRSIQSHFGWGDPRVELQYFATGVPASFFPDPTFEDTVDFARAWRPDLVISDPTSFPGGVAAQVVGAAHARLLFGVDRVVQLRDAVLAQRSPAGEPLQNWLQPVVEGFGADFDEAVVLGHWTISPMPTWIWHPDGVHYLPIRHLPFNGPSTIPRWLYDQPARRRVCLTLGTSHREAKAGLAPSADDLFEAVADLDVEVVATLDAHQLGSTSAVPDNVRAVDYVPLNVLLPSCSAIVHSGGAGTFAAALEYGVPQVIVPHEWDTQKWWGPVAMGDGLEARGAGVYPANADMLTVDALRDSLKVVLEDPSYAANAAQVRVEVRAMPSPNDVVPVLEELTAQYRRSATEPTKRRMG
jgi:glycosyltransferase (activator-dependent family)